MIYFDFLEIIIINELWSWLQYFNNLKESAIWAINPETRTKHTSLNQCYMGIRICYRYLLIITWVIHTGVKKDLKSGFGVEPWFSIFLKLKKKTFLTLGSLPVLWWKLLVLWCFRNNPNQQFFNFDFFLNNKSTVLWIWNINKRKQSVIYKT